MWQQWVNTILGLWIVMIAFMGLTATMLFWSLVVTGVVVAALGLWGAVSHGSMMDSEHRLAHR